MKTAHRPDVARQLALLEKEVSGATAGRLHDAAQPTLLIARIATVQGEFMTRFAIDAVTAIRLAEDARPLPSEHSLVAPTVLKSHTLDALFRDVQSSRRTERDALELERRIVVMRIRLLSDRMSQRTAWTIASQLGQDGIGDAEYLAVTRLQADALIAGSPTLTRAAKHLVPTAPYESLHR